MWGISTAPSRPSDSLLANECRGVYHALCSPSCGAWAERGARRLGQDPSARSKNHARARRRAREATQEREGQEVESKIADEPEPGPRAAGPFLPSCSFALGGGVGRRSHPGLTRPPRSATSTSTR